MDIQIRKAWKSAANVGCALVMLLLPFSPARGDTVSDWNAIAVHMAASSEPSRAARELAAVHAAMFEAMNFVEGRYVPRFLVKPGAPLSSSSEIEAAVAAHYVLTQLYPGHEALLDAALARSLAAFSDRATMSSARIWGRHLAGNVYALWPAQVPASDAKSASMNAAAFSRVSLFAKEMDAGVEAWDSKLMRLVAGKTLEPIDRARILALASFAASDVYSAVDTAHDREELVPCVSCAVDAAVQVVLESEFGPASVAALSSKEASWTPVRSDITASPGTGAAMGKRIGMQVLSYYKRDR
jgi:hypothetical protein